MSDNASHKSWCLINDHIENKNNDFFGSVISYTPQRYTTEVLEQLNITSLKTWPLCKTSSFMTSWRHQHPHARSCDIHYLSRLFVDGVPARPFSTTSLSSWGAGERGRGAPQRPTATGKTCGRWPRPACHVTTGTLRRWRSSGRGGGSLESDRFVGHFCLLLKFLKK